MRYHNALNLWWRQQSNRKVGWNPLTPVTPTLLSSPPPEIGVSGGDSLLKLTEIIIMMATPTQTHPKFIWRFFSCQQFKYFIVEATSEQEARSLLPDSPCVFSARIRQEVGHA
ncbi:host cell division inhibitor Icd-like protein [Providencia sp. PROV247]|uniref:host cell division inhibitor Icd-like protein n=2 Tax=unclassified Providencia TaxID=2633465 RepID=UPI003FA6DC81